MRRLEKTLGTDGRYRGRFCFIFLIMLVFLSVTTRSRLVNVDERNSQNHDIVPNGILWMKFHCKSRWIDRNSRIAIHITPPNRFYACLTSLFCSAVFCRHPIRDFGKHEYLLEESKLGSPPM